MIALLPNWYTFYNGGNQWSGYWLSFLTFFRHVAKLDLDYSKYDHYEKAGVHAGPRFMHRRFWIASDRPECVHKDEQHRPHRMDGPQTKWRDGWEMHYIAGIPVPAKITAGEFGVREIQAENNAEVRRVMINRYERDDQGRYLRDAGATVVSSDIDSLGKPRRLLRIEIPDDEPYVAVEVTNSTAEPDGTFKRYTLRVPPETKTCHEGIAWTFGVEPAKYHPRIET